MTSTACPAPSLYNGCVVIDVASSVPRLLVNPPCEYHTDTFSCQLCVSAADDRQLPHTLVLLEAIHGLYFKDLDTEGPLRNVAECLSEVGQRRTIDHLLLLTTWIIIFGHTVFA
jgi:hypothetical protein